MSDFKFDIGANVDEVTKALNKVKKDVSGLESVLKSVADTAVFDKLDKETDGFASKVVDLGKAIKDSLGEVKNTGGVDVFKQIKLAITNATRGTLGLQKAWKLAKVAVFAFRTALISTGIGALVVAVGLLVGYWDDIVALVSGVSKETAKLTKDLAEQEKTQKRALTLLNSSTNTLKLQGKSQLEINRLKQKELESLILIKKAQISNFRDTLNQLQGRQDAIKKVIDSIVGFINTAITGVQLLVTTAIRGLIFLANKLPGININVDDAIENLNSVFNTAKQGIEKIGDFVLPDLGIKDLKQQLEDAELEAVKLQNTLDGLKLDEQKIISEQVDRPKDLKPIQVSIEPAGNTQSFVDTYLNTLNQITAGTSEVFANTNAIIGEGFIQQALALQSFVDGVNELIGSSLVGAFSELGEAIGKAIASGTNVVGAIGQSLLKSLGKFLGEFGDLLIKYGIASLAFSKLQLSLATPGGALITAPVAIAAGIALKALAGAVASAGSGDGGGGGGGASSSSGGGVSNNTSTSTTFQGGGEGRVVFEIAGDKLIGVINNSLSASDRIGAGQNID